MFCPTFGVHITLLAVYKNIGQVTCREGASAVCLVFSQCFEESVARKNLYVAHPPA